MKEICFKNNKVKSIYDELTSYYHPPTYQFNVNEFDSMTRIILQYRHYGLHIIDIFHSEDKIRVKFGGDNCREKFEFIYLNWDKRYSIWTEPICGLEFNRVSEIMDFYTFGVIKI